MPADNDNQLALVVQQSGLDVNSPKAKLLLEQFSDYFEIAADWEKKAAVIVVTNAGQKAEMNMAREGRLFLRGKRIDIEKKRKELKEQALREGKAIDGMANILKALIVPIEEYLGKQERFIEIKAAEIAEQMRIEAEQKAEEERIAKEKAEAEERERIRLENECLKKEAEKQERILQEERAKAEAEKRKQTEALAMQKAAAEKERLRQAKVLADAKAKADAEKARIEAERQKELAKIKAKREAELKAAEAEKVKVEAAHKKQQAELEAKLKTLITCPHCGGKLYPDGTC